MIVLATAAPEVRIDGGSVIISFPSGHDTVEVSLTYHEAMRLASRMMRMTGEATKPPRPPAEFIDLAKRRRVRKAATAEG